MHYVGEGKGEGEEETPHSVYYFCIFVFLSLSMKECSRGVAGKKKNGRGTQTNN